MVSMKRIIEIIIVSVPYRGSMSFYDELFANDHEFLVSVPYRGSMSFYAQTFFVNSLNYVSVPYRGSMSFYRNGREKQNGKEKFPSPIGVL